MSATDNTKLSHINNNENKHFHHRWVIEYSRLVKTNFSPAYNQRTVVKQLLKLVFSWQVYHLQPHTINIGEVPTYE